MSTSFSFGQRVVLTGLKSRCDLNGKIGIVKKCIDISGRYQIILTGEVNLALKAENIELCDVEL